MDHTIIPKEWKNVLNTIKSIYPSAVIAGGALRDLICGTEIKDVDIFIKDPGFDVEISVETLQKLFPEIKNLEREDVGDYIIEFINVRDDKNTIYEEPSIVIQEYFSSATKSKNYEFSYYDSHCPTNAQVSKLLKEKGIAVNHIPSHFESFVTAIYDIKYNSVVYQLIFIEEQNPVQYVLTNFDIGLCKILFDGNKLIVSDEFKYDLENKQLTFSGKFTKAQILHTTLDHIPRLQKKFKGFTAVIDGVIERKKDEMPASYQAVINELLKQTVNKNELKINFDKLFSSDTDGDICDIDQANSTFINNAPINNSMPMETFMNLVNMVGKNAIYEIGNIITAPEKAELIDYYTDVKNNDEFYLQLLNNQHQEIKQIKTRQVEIEHPILGSYSKIDKDNLDQLGSTHS